MTDNASEPARVEERLRAGDRRFSKLEQRIDASDAAVKAHLQRQDEKIDAIVASVSLIQTNTQSMVDTWEEARARCGRCAVLPMRGASLSGTSLARRSRSARSA
ncbi:hypothetical protein [Burkholderia arboris]|uniref:hypothetical protein n=1 Tax=Burkholderia arboris TaxID=488730 RepID=UPI00210D4C6E|nr:hypothetical protein [Burkholderia arboris]UTV56442.1 hypothetical protein NLX30_08735 [Burkholderia arboris]